MAPHTCDLLAEFVLAMKYVNGLKKILGTIYPYPTFAKASKFTAGVRCRNHAPGLVLRLLESIHRWHRS